MPTTGEKLECSFAKMTAPVFSSSTIFSSNNNNKIIIILLLLLKKTSCLNYILK
jgi:hypothetical protein